MINIKTANTKNPTLNNVGFFFFNSNSYRSTYTIPNGFIPELS